MSSPSSKPTLIAKLAGAPLVHKAIRELRIQPMAEGALSRIPFRRKLKSSGFVYRVRFLESFLVADEIFARQVYRAAFEGRDVRTFVDLGANVGYFTLYAADRMGRRDLIALSVDANEACTAEARWHVEHNHFTRTKVMTGVAGYPPDVTSATFYINASNIASSVLPVLNGEVPAKGKSEAVTLPAIDVMGEWKKLAEGQRINLLKVDVEGFECELIRNSADLLRCTDRIVIEWHKWVTSLGEVDELLAQRAFVRRAAISEDAHAGIAIYDRTP